MRMKMEDGWLYIIEASPAQGSSIKAWGLMKWKRKDLRGKRTAKKLMHNPELSWCQWEQKVFQRGGIYGS